MIVIKMPSSSYSNSSEVFIPKDSLSRSPVVCLAMCIHKTAHSFRKLLCLQFPIFHLPQPSLQNNFKRWERSIKRTADGNGLNSSPTDNSNGGTRLIKAIKALLVKLDTRIKEFRKNLPVKLLFFLVGFFCATAFATVIGQTGDWDILSAALAVVVVEGIGALMYRASLPLIGKVRSLITMFNYWKAGLSLGLFLDSFKY